MPRSLKSLEVWNPKITLPSFLIEEAKEIEVPHKVYKKGHKLRDDGGVDLTRMFSQDGLVCDGWCGWHNDNWLDNRYTSMLVIRNDTDSYVRAEKVRTTRPQPPGTLILLDFHVEHCLFHPKGENAPYGVWFALDHQYNQRPSREDVEHYFKYALEKMEYERDMEIEREARIIKPGMRI